MKSHTIQPNFKYPVITKRDYRFGSGQVTAPILCPTGDWRSYVPNEEIQNKYGVESSACFVEAQQHAIATLIEQMYGIKDQDYSSRFNAILSDASPEGGDPLVAAESIRKIDGMIPDFMLPFTDSIKSWEDFTSFKNGDEQACREEGHKWLNDFEARYDIVFERNEDVTIKYAKLREALKWAPVAISVKGWYRNSNGEFYKPQGHSDNHLTLCVYLDDNNRPYFWDTYEPVVKIGEPFYNSDFAMRWSIKKKVYSPTLPWWKKLWNWCIKQKLIYRKLKLLEIYARKHEKQS